MYVAFLATMEGYEMDVNGAIEVMRASQTMGQIVAAVICKACPGLDEEAHRGLVRHGDFPCVQGHGHAGEGGTRATRGGQAGGVMTTVEILRAARTLLLAPAGHKCAGQTGSRCAAIAVWDIGYGNETLMRSAEAAIARGMGVRYPAHGAPHSTAPGLHIFEWNDSHSHAEVLAAFDRAISWEEAKEAEHHWRAFLPQAGDTVGSEPVPVPA